MSKVLRRALNLFKHHSPQDKQLIASLKMIVGYKPFNLKIFKLATLHSSVATTNVSGFKESNERLEYLGDAILGSVVAEYLFKKYPYKDEGFLTEIRSRIVNREALNSLGRKLGLDKIIQLDTSRRGAFTHKSIYGDTLEALVGAVYLDRGYNYCRQFVLTYLIEPNFDIEDLIRTNTNYKSQIIEWSQKMGKSIRFEASEVSETGNYKEFEVQIFVDATVVAIGHGPNKKKAEQTASRKAIDTIPVE